MIRKFCAAAAIVFAACAQSTPKGNTPQASAMAEPQNGSAASTTTASIPPPPPAAVSSKTTTTTTVTKQTTTTTKKTTGKEDKPMSYYQNKVAELHTSAGEIDIRFYPEAAPNHVKNFIDLAEKGFYNGTKFHRVIPGFMVQGGDPNTATSDTSSWGTGGSGQHLKAEFNDIHHARGIVSMARAQDPNSASSQFFICVADSGFLDKQYTVFGVVTKGMDIADKIVSAKRNAQDRPDNPTTIDKVVVRDAKPDEKAPAK